MVLRCAYSGRYLIRSYMYIVYTSEFRSHIFLYEIFFGGTFCFYKRMCMCNIFDHQQHFKWILCAIINFSTLSACVYCAICNYLHSRPQHHPAHAQNFIYCFLMMFAPICTKHVYSTPHTRIVGPLILRAHLWKKKRFFFSFAITDFI